MNTHTKIPLAGGNAPRRVTSTPKVKASAHGRIRPNTSILNFFTKITSEACLQTDSSKYEDDSESLFLEDTCVRMVEDVSAGQVPTPPQEGAPVCSSVEDSRFNEDGGSNKRRRTNGKLLNRSLSPTLSVEEALWSDLTGAVTGHSIQVEADQLAEQQVIKEEHGKFELIGGYELAPVDEVHDSHVRLPTIQKAPPELKREATSAMCGEELDELEGYNDDETVAEMGEEFLERRFAEAQRLLEEAADEDMQHGGCRAIGIKEEEVEEAREQCFLDADAPPCPVCNVALAGITSEQASTHVNNCLDGRFTPLPRAQIQPSGVKDEPPAPYRRFMKAAVARPAQQNPFSFSADAPTEGGSAFSKLMSNHAEDAAWAAAAANELASRGKPAFKRTCPFYKILPGFFICVDAFRYGAVQGCSAYFLSHFHSDHYIGLTSSWCHGPIYCSKVTANLVKQQLRVDPKYVIALDFEKKIEVPGTQGVHVTMIPANHCPGSSLFLYEKVVGKGKNPKIQRVLHCGDFRACPAHVQHPLLRPEVVDLVTGKKKQQKLDVCYLDTTYLTPKYAFPVQQEVIKACADMCISLSKEFVDENDGWERTKRERAGSGMVNFVRSETMKQKQDESNSFEPANQSKSRGRLLVIVGTYSIGKERICMGIAKALNSKIYATPGKQRICAALEDPELTALLTSNPLEAQVHMQMIMEIRAETLADYLTSYKPHFSRIVGFRPSGWNYRPPNSRFTESPLVQTVLHSENWKSTYSMHDLVPQRGSTREASCFGVPYSEHSSFRELTMFCNALHIDRIIPTVNIGSAKSRDRMKGWIDKWDQEKKKNGLFKVADGQTVW